MVNVVLPFLKVVRMYVCEWRHGEIPTIDEHISSSHSAYIFIFKDIRFMYRYTFIRIAPISDQNGYHRHIRMKGITSYAQACFVHIAM